MLQPNFAKEPSIPSRSNTQPKRTLRQNGIKLYDRQERPVGNKSVYAIAALVGIGNTNVLVDYDILNKAKHF